MTVVASLAVPPLRPGVAPDTFDLDLAAVPEEVQRTMPAGCLLWFWRLYLHGNEAGVGAVQFHPETGRHHSHASGVRIQHQRRGLYSRLVLPALAARFGVICCDTNRPLSAGAVAAWRRAGGQEDPDRADGAGPGFCLVGRL